MNDVEQAKHAGPLRVALCITELAAGGAEQALVELATRLDDSRFATEVYSLAPRPDEGRDRLARRLDARGITTHYLGAASPLHFWRTLGRLTRGMRRQRPQLLQTFLFHANVIGKLAARRAGVRHVVWGHRVAEQGSNWHNRVQRWLARGVDRHVSVSEGVADRVRTTIRVPDDRVTVIGNGVDRERFGNAIPADLSQFGVPAGRRAIVCVGRLERQKRPLWLLEAAGRFLPQLPEHDLLLVGDGPQRATIERRLLDDGLRDRVRLCGWLDDVAPVLAAADLLVLPSAWEGMPNSVLEAMAAGLPVVATRVEGVSQLLGDEQLVAVDDLTGFSDRVVRMLREHGLAARLGEENRLCVGRQCSWDEVAAQYAQLYEAICGRS